jgi:hypothetical protein
MNGGDPELDELLAPLRDGPVSLTGSEAQSARRTRLLPGVRSAVRGAPRVVARRRLLRRARAGGLAAAVLASSFWLASNAAFRAPAAVTQSAPPSRAHVQVESQGEEPLAWIADGADERAIDGSDELQTAGELRARAGARAALVTEEGARVDVLPRSRLRMLGERPASGVETLSLLEGEVHCRVPPLPDGRSFVITTPKTRVVVHGTDFRVRVGGARGTCVRVREGLVEVQSDGASAWLGPGSEWGCEDGAPASAARPNKAARSGEASHGRSRARGTRDRTESKEPARSEPVEGTLAVETRLLVEALRAEQQGQKSQASSLFTRLIATYPGSPLVPEAQSGLARVR